MKSQFFYTQMIPGVPIYHVYTSEKNRGLGIRLCIVDKEGGRWRVRVKYNEEPIASGPTREAAINEYLDRRERG